MVGMLRMKPCPRRRVGGGVHLGHQRGVGTGQPLGGARVARAGQGLVAGQLDQTGEFAAVQRAARGQQFQPQGDVAAR